MARWQSGYAAACKAVDVGSIPALASKANLGLQAWIDGALTDVAQESRCHCAVQVGLEPLACLQKGVTDKGRGSSAKWCKMTVAWPNMVGARMAESVDAADLKSAGCKTVPVRVRLRAPWLMRLHKGLHHEVVV